MIEEEIQRLRDRVSDLERHVKDGEVFDAIYTRLANLEKQANEQDQTITEHFKWSNHPGEQEAEQLREFLRWVLQKLAGFGLHDSAKDVDEVCKRIKQTLVK
jgi:hypothetical protein